MKKIYKASVPYQEVLENSLRNDEEAQYCYLRANFEDNSDMPSVILSAIRTVAKVRGFKDFADEANLNRENLYRVLSKDGNPRFDTFLKILDALNLRLSVETKKKKAS